MKSDMLKQYILLISLFLILSVFVLPWWFFLIVGIIAMWFFESYYFAIFIGFLGDLLHASPLIVTNRDLFFGIHLQFLPDFLVKWPFTLTMLIFFLLFDVIKKRVRM